VQQAARGQSFIVQFAAKVGLYDTKAQVRSAMLPEILGRIMKTYILVRQLLFHAIICVGL
jgi:hypothetical protein